MPPPQRRPWTDADGDRLAELHAQGRTCGQIAIEMGRSKQTIGRYARKAGLGFDRSRTAQANKAKAIDNQARRTTLETEFLVKAAQLLAEIDQPAMVFSFGGSDNVYNEHQLDSPPTKDKRDLIYAAAQAAVAASRLHELNSEGRDLPAVDAWLNHVLGAP